MNKQSGLWWKSKLLVLLLALLIISSALAQEETQLADFQQNPSVDDFSKLTLEDQTTYLLSLSPTSADFQKYAVEFYKTAANVGKKEELDFKYFGNKDNLGKNQESDDKFFSSTP
ncbi:MAG: hypothetical protein ABIA37_03165, partial [Candidatus Woesearchaeota archaeon]